MNGFYLVKIPVVDASLPQTTILETVYCAFKQEGTYNPWNVQKPVVSPFSPPNSVSPSLSSPSFTSPDDICFYASVFRNKNHPSNEAIKFQNAGMLNFDQHFNKMTGYFKSPKNRIYDFSYERTSYTKIDNGTSVNFYMNDNLVVNTISSTSEAIMGKTSNQVILKLNKGDTICVKATNKKNNGNVSSNEPISFEESVAGFLLKAQAPA